jgi:hypothetical protein
MLRTRDGTTDRSARDRQRPASVDSAARFAPELVEEPLCLLVFERGLHKLIELQDAGVAHQASVKPDGLGAVSTGEGKLRHAASAARGRRGLAPACSIPKLSQRLQTWNRLGGERPLDQREDLLPVVWRASRCSQARGRILRRL